MNKVNLYFAPLLLLVLFVLCPASSAADNYVQSFPKGLIDWTNGVVDAFGVGMPLQNSGNAAKERAVAKRNALALARKNLVDLVEGIRIDSKCTVKDLIQKGSVSVKSFRKALLNSQLVDLSYRRDGSVKATVAFWFSGSFFELLLPKSIVVIENVKQPNKLLGKKKPFTGVVVDCRGFKVEPSLVPKVVDEDGGVVYGPAYASRDCAVKHGMVVYVRGISAGRKNPRVSPRPLCVKGIRTAKSGVSDIVISNADGAWIRSTASNLELMKKCKVVIVLD